MFNPEAIQAAPAPVGRPSVWALLGQIWLRPRRALGAVVAGSRSLWLIPFFFALGLMTARVFVGAPLLAQVQRERSQAMMEANLANMPAEYRETLPPEAMQMPEPSKALTLGVPLFLGVGGILLGWLLRAGLLQVGSMAMGGRQSFGSMYKVSAWAHFPLILRELVQMLYMLVTHQVIVGPGLSGLVSQPEFAAAGALAGGARTSIASALLGRVDLYAIWYILLLVVAVRSAGKMTRGKALTVVGVYVLLSLVSSLLGIYTGRLTGGF